MVEATTREEIWEFFRKASHGITEVYACVPTEFVEVKEPADREEVAERVEQLFQRVPGLITYSRVGMYDFVGGTKAAKPSLLKWAHDLRPPENRGGPLVRWGFACRGDEGLATIERLMLGTVEAARSHGSCLVFDMGGDGWVRPAED